MGFRVETGLLNPDKDQYAGDGGSMMNLAFIASEAARLESLGFDSIAVPEAGHDPFLALVVAAEHTERVELATNVAISFPRSPMVTAQMAWDLQQYSDGRFVLGLGTQVKGHNKFRYATAWDSPPGPRMREYLGCLRAIYNALFAAQSPDGRRLRYFTPFEGSRDFFDGDTYCCPNNFRRSVSELPQMVYYRFDGGMAVNLYTTSKATVQVGDGLVAAVKQETDYPNSGRVAIELCLPEPARFEVRLRIPAWCRGAAVTVDGEPINSAIKPGRFLAIERDWQRETMIELDLPMSWRLIRGRRLQAGRVAVMRGPVGFCCHEPADGALTLDPATLDGPTAGHAIRPDGMVALASTRRGNTADEKQLVLTEFADPDGRTTYFNLPDLDAAEDDELKHADANP